MTHGVIRAMKDGFRRCGVAHPARDVVHPAEAFSEEDWERLFAEPNLNVRPATPEEIAAWEIEKATDEPVVDEATGLTAEQTEAIEAAIRALPLDGFTSKGQPKVGDVQAKVELADFAPKAKEIGLVFNAMIEAGFEPPVQVPQV